MSLAAWVVFGRMGSCLEIRLTREFEFAAAGVAVVFGSEVPDGVVAQVGRSKDHVTGATATKKG